MLVAGSVEESMSVRFGFRNRMKVGMTVVLPAGMNPVVYSKASGVPLAVLAVVKYKACQFQVISKASSDAVSSVLVVV